MFAGIAAQILTTDYGLTRPGRLLVAAEPRLVLAGGRIAGLVVDE